MDLDEFLAERGRNVSTGLCCKPDAHLGATEKVIGPDDYDDDDPLRDYYGFMRPGVLNTPSSEK